MNWSLLGHEWAVGLLSQHVAQGQVRHAYLFTGPQGVGRRTLALRLAQALNCPQPTAAKTPTEKTHLQRQIDSTDREIDRLVYELYGLTEEEIRIVEGG